MASRKRSKMTAHCNRRNGTETLLCDVIVVLNTAAFLRHWVVRGEGFGSKYKPYFTWKMAEEFARCSAGIIRLFFVVVFLSNCRLATCHIEVENRRYRVFLDCKLTKLVRGSQQTPYYMILFEAVSVKCFTQTCECFEGMKHSLFIFIAILWVNFKVPKFDFEWFFPEAHCELETKTVSKLPHF